MISSIRFSNLRLSLPRLGSGDSAYSLHTRRIASAYALGRQRVRSTASSQPFHADSSIRLPIHHTSG
jgi:hypothetical protein